MDTSENQTVAGVDAVTSWLDVNLYLHSLGVVVTGNDTAVRVEGSRIYVGSSGDRSLADLIWRYQCIKMLEDEEAAPRIG